MFLDDAKSFAFSEGYKDIKQMNNNYKNYEVFALIRNDGFVEKTKFLLVKDDEIRYADLSEYLNIASINLDDFDYVKDNMLDPFYLFESYGDNLKIGERIIVNNNGDIEYYKITDSDDNNNFIHNTYHSDTVVDEIKNIMTYHKDFISEMKNVRVLNDEFNTLDAWDEKIICDDLKFIAHSPCMHQEDELYEYKDNKKIFDNYVRENKYISFSNDILDVIHRIRKENNDID